MCLFKSQTHLAMAYTNEVGDKIYPIIVDIKRGIKSTEEIQFMSSDINTGVLSVAFIQGNDNYNVTGADVVCSVMRPDASTLDIPCTIVENNIVEVPLGINGTSQDGVYSFDFKVFKGGNKVVGTPIMNYSVSLSIDNDMVVEEDDRLPVLTVLMTQLTELKGEARESINQANTATVASREATAKAIEATNNANAVSERVSQETSEVISRVDNKVTEIETRFNALTSSQQQDAEVIDARDGETSLKARLDRDIEKAKQVYVELEGNHISTESSTGAIQDLEILGNTVQDPNNLADIKSVGELQEDGTYKMSILSCGKNLINNSKVEKGFYVQENNSNVISNNGFTTSNYIKIKPNTKYVLNKLISYKAFYDRNKNIIPVNPTYDVNTFTTPTNASYVRISVSNANDITTYQLEEGTVATSYEPYQENKCDILLPCQLEKVGDVADRLYYDDVEKAWCIEKNIGNITLDITKDWRFLSSNNTIWYPAKHDAKIWSQSIKSVACQIDFDSANNIVVVKDGLSSLEEYKNIMPIYVKYQLATPQKIVLPLNTQIALNSFFGTTHIYMESGEVEGTIKCKIPKSLGATVQSLNNKTDILSDRIESIEGLKDSQNMKYETDKGYLVCKETKNGVIDDLKIEGKTLVNLGGMVRGTYNKYNSILDSIQLLAPNSEYTFIISNTAGHDVALYINEGIFNNQPTFTVKANSTSIVSCTTKDIVNQLPLLKSSSNDGTIINLNVILLEGDHTQNPPSYFEGLMSVGQDVDEISVESCYNVADIATEGNTNFDVAHIKKGITYSMSSKRSKDFGYNLILKPISGGNQKVLVSGTYKDFTTFVSDVEGILHFNSYEGMDISEIMILPSLYTEDTMPKFKPYSPDKKQILFYNENGELEPIQELHEWDSIEKHSDNKWYYHKRSGKVVLNGSENENWLKNGVLSTDTYAFMHLQDQQIKPTNSMEDFICDKLIPANYNNASSECISKYADGTQIVIKISTSKLSTNNEAGFKQWLQANNVTVIYQLAQEEVYELAPLHLDSYANETLILCNSGAISPRMEFSITSHINELVKSQGDRISLLEEKMYKALKQVLAGDMYSLAELLYPEDFVEENPENEIMLL